MKIILHPSQLQGTVLVPPSKSYTHRALILASLANGTSTVSGLLRSRDTLITMAALKKLGVRIKDEGRRIKIEGISGRFHLPSSPLEIDVSDSGTTLRFLIALGSLTDGEIIITGTKRLTERPIGKLITALRNLGIEASACQQNNYPPVKIKGGQLKGESITIDAHESSQFVSALLIISPFALKPVSLTVKNLASAPYVDITCHLMDYFGATVKRDENVLLIRNPSRFVACDYTVEGDFSSASYFLAAAAITQSSLTLKGLNPKTKQGDSYFLKILEKMGCQINWQKDRVTIQPGKLRALKIDLCRYPDLVPALSVTAAFADGITTITNIAHLRHKESDRIAALAKELTKMGVRVRETRDSLTIEGGKPHGAFIETHEDHRIAMSLAVAALGAQGKTIIQKGEVVTKSYPNFWTDLKRIGTRCKIINL